MKNLVSQLHTTTNKLDKSRGTSGYVVDINDFGSKSNEKLSKSKKSIIADYSGATEESKFLTSNTKKAFNLLQQGFTKVLIL